MKNKTLQKNYIDKHIISLLTCLIILITVTGCSSDKKETDAITNKTTTQETTTELAITTTEAPTTTTTKPSYKITLVNLTSPVGAGAMATITIKGAPNTNYGITVYYDSGASNADGLYAKQSDGNGNVTWTWKVGTRTHSGTHSIVISGGGNTYNTSFETT